MSSEHGVNTEEDVRQVAAVLGLPDFVYTVPKIETATSTREVGDALLVVGDRRAMVQVKSRHPDSADDGSRWVPKAAARATKQAEGSHRNIRRRIRDGRPLTAYSVRTLGLSDGTREASEMLLETWPEATPTVVVLDHPAIEGVKAPENEHTFFISLDDWRRLNEACRSVANVLDYVVRIIASNTPRVLGRELGRFRRVVRADTDAAAKEGGTPHFTFDALTDPEGAQLYRELVERVWPPDHRLPPNVTVDDYRTIVTALDEMPPGAAVTLGRRVLDKRRELSRTGDQQGLTAILDRRTLLVYSCKQLSGDEDLRAFDAELGARTAVRLREMKEHGCQSPHGIGVGHAVSAEGVANRYVYIEGDVEVTREVRRMVLHSLGRLLLSEGRTERFGSAKRNSPCPCGSGLKFKKCDLIARGFASRSVLTQRGAVPERNRHSRAPRCAIMGEWTSTHTASRSRSETPGPTSRQVTPRCSICPGRQSRRQRHSTTRTPNF